MFKEFKEFAIHPCEGPALPAVHFTVGGGNHLMTSCGHRDNKMGRRL